MSGSWVIVGLSLAALLAGGGCAKGSEFSGGGGAGNGSAEGGGGSSNGGAGSGSAAGGQATSGEGGAATGGEGGTGSTTSDTETTTTSDTETTTTTTTDMACAGGQHECNGVCVGNTTVTGCSQSVSCTPCGAAPANASSVCSAAGLCDFNCQGGYNKQGSACVCASQCCSNADCPGGSCVAGMCQAVAGTCDDSDCQAMCFIQCLAMMKPGIGTCQGNLCSCMCIG